MNKLIKIPVLQLKQSNSPLTDTRATDLIIKSGQKDTEASIQFLCSCRLLQLGLFFAGVFYRTFVDLGGVVKEQGRELE